VNKSTSNTIPLSLQVVSLEQVLLHENTDQRRVDRLKARLSADGILSNPPIVIKTNSHYVVLDGATRTEAFKQLNYPDIVVQVVSPDNGVDLHTWHHVIGGLTQPDLLKMLADIPEIEVKKSNLQKVYSELYNGLCYLHTASDEVYIINAAPDAEPFYALNKLTETYISGTHVERTLNKKMTTLRNEFPEMTALVVFPEYTIDRVLHIAQSGQRMPAGITRFIIQGRVLRVNVDLDYLKSNKPLAEKNAWLRQLIVKKLNNGAVRYYQEPVYLLDE
jgi:hypothetical protein